MGRCRCKGECANRRCGCRRDKNTAAPCTEACKCDPNRCRNRTAKNGAVARKRGGGGAEAAAVDSDHGTAAMSLGTDRTWAPLRQPMLVHVPAADSTGMPSQWAPIWMWLTQVFTKMEHKLRASTHRTFYSYRGKVYVYTDRNDATRHPQRDPGYLTDRKEVPRAVLALGRPTVAAPFRVVVPPLGPQTRRGGASPSSASSSGSISRGRAPARASVSAARARAVAPGRSAFVNSTGARTERQTAGQGERGPCKVGMTRKAVAKRVSDQARAEGLPSTQYVVRAKGSVFFCAVVERAFFMRCAAWRLRPRERPVLMRRGTSAKRKPKRTAPSWSDRGNTSSEEGWSEDSNGSSSAGTSRGRGRVRKGGTEWVDMSPSEAASMLCLMAAVVHQFAANKLPDDMFAACCQGKPYVRAAPAPASPTNDTAASASPSASSRAQHQQGKGTKDGTAVSGGSAPSVSAPPVPQPAAATAEGSPCPADKEEGEGEGAESSTTRADSDDNDEQQQLRPFSSSHHSDEEHEPDDQSDAEHDVAHDVEDVRSDGDQPTEEDKGEQREREHGEEEQEEEEQQEQEAQRHVDVGEQEQEEEEEDAGGEHAREQHHLLTVPAAEPINADDGGEGAAVWDNVLEWQ